jgi:hypothetical protein
MGYTVSDSNGHKYFMTTAHGPNGYHASNAATGDTIFQAWRIENPSPMGRIAINPSWITFDCPSGSDYCPVADVVLADFINGMTPDFKIGTSMTEGQNGNAGSAAINNRYAVQGPVTPEWVDTTSNGIHKSGFATGTTTGQIDAAIMSGYLTLDWGPTGGSTKVEYLDNLTRVAHAGWGGGDSGSPVFAGNGVTGGGYPYYVLGILVGGFGTVDGNKRCNQGSTCAFAFNRWADIETQLGKKLNPATNQTSSSPSTYSVSIVGPSDAIVGCFTEWQASPSGGSGPYTYSYSLNNGLYDTDGTEYVDFTPSGSGALSITVMVTDANGNSAYAAKSVTVTGGNCD